MFSGIKFLYLLVDKGFLCLVAYHRHKHTQWCNQNSYCSWSPLPLNFFFVSLNFWVELYFTILREWNIYMHVFSLCSNREVIRKSMQIKMATCRTEPWLTISTSNTSISSKHRTEPLFSKADYEQHGPEEGLTTFNEMIDAHLSVNPPKVLNDKWESMLML